MKKIFFISILLTHTLAQAGAYIPIDHLIEDEDKAEIAKARAKSRYLGEIPGAGNEMAGKSKNNNCSVEVGNVQNDNRAGKISPREIKVIVLGNITNSSDCKK